MVFNGGVYNQSVVFQLHSVNVNIEFNYECRNTRKEIIDLLHPYIFFDDPSECFRDHTILYVWIIR